ncbi:MAG: hypothetical protein JW793_00435 [Acidobacteria bacterium]|nr:hypothetical protein [Acidobacteriota bacterium]
MKNLIIHGEGFAFTISEPEGWTVHIDDAAKKRLNAYFVVDGYSYDNTPGLIYIRVLKKQELTVEEHLKADMERFSQDDKGVVFEEFRPAGISYSFASKKYLFGDRYCDYLCYVDPGEKYNSYIIFVLSADMGNCSEYNDIYGQFLKSFFWITDEVFDRTNKNKGP